LPFFFFLPFFFDLRPILCTLHKLIRKLAVRKC
jgi:hypothetical protein